MSVEAIITKRIKRLKRYYDRNIQNSGFIFRWIKTLFFPSDLIEALAENPINSFKIINTIANDIWFFQRWFFKPIQDFFEENWKISQVIRVAKALNSVNGFTEPHFNELINKVNADVDSNAYYPLIWLADCLEELFEAHLLTTKRAGTLLCSQTRFQWQRFGISSAKMVGVLNNSCVDLILEHESPEHVVFLLYGLQESALLTSQNILKLKQYLPFIVNAGFFRINYPGSSIESTYMHKFFNLTQIEFDAMIYLAQANPSDPLAAGRSIRMYIDSHQKSLREAAERLNEEECSSNERMSREESTVKGGSPKSQSEHNEVGQNESVFWGCANCRYSLMYSKPNREITDSEPEPEVQNMISNAFGSSSE